MNVGSLGGIVFSVSAEKIRTLRDLVRSVSSNTSTHSRHNGTGLVEYTGRAPDQITFSVRVSRYLGMAPADVINVLESYVTNGTAVTFVLGGERMGSYRWLVKQYKETVINTDTHGMPIDSDVSLTLIEYCRR